MPFSGGLKSPTLLKKQEHARFDYPEILVLLLTVALVAMHFEFNSVSMALFAIVSLPSLMILVYNYQRQPSFWTSNIVVVLFSTVIGSMQFCTVLSLSLSLLIGIRIILSEPENRLKLMMIFVVTAIMFYYVSITLYSDMMVCNEDLISPTILLASIITVFWQFWSVYHKYLSYEKTAEKAKGRLNTLVSVISKLTRFIPPQVWQPIVKSDSAVNVNNKRAKLTIMFSDIAGFTELSDSLSSDNLADILNTYMKCMTVIANKHGAMLDKFVGDGMVCFFGEPNSRGTRQDALDCVAMAIDMRREMRSLRQEWRLMGFEGLYVRIGITTGYCHVGNFGSNNRISYTIIGKEANLASRLESIAGKGDILISQRTYDYICHDYECEYAGTYQLKGFDSSINAWQVLDPDANKGRLSKWVDHTLPGFNLHLNFKDMQNYDYKEIKSKLNFALERIEKEEKEHSLSNK
ncbi:adenylate/guanylate cyclase domain-containing protein [uncultured Psychrobacter sp.]|uniref:adenylate/guanylate cyclase domain-containing protein n=1 Tax=uncultured Psychrobacter sp. TaxID=259303 RepID=UPI002611A4BF|nr:adenylate/guanylate cyclase domain-containing protein [uncultured Psychrobacter sp.]